MVRLESSALMQDCDVSLRQTLATNIRIMLLNKRMTNRDFAEQLGEEESTVSLWVRGKREPRLEKIGEMAKVFGVDPSLLISEATDHVENEAEKLARIEQGMRIKIANEIAAPAGAIVRILAKKSPVKKN